MSEITPDGKLTATTARRLRELSEHEQDINDLDNGGGYRNSVAIDAALDLLAKHGLVEVGE